MEIFFRGVLERLRPAAQGHPNEVEVPESSNRFDTSARGGARSVTIQKLFYQQLTQFLNSSFEGVAVYNFGHFGSMKGGSFGMALPLN